MKKIVPLIFFGLFSVNVFAQNDLLAELSKTADSIAPDKVYTYEIFEDYRLINGHSVEIPNPAELVFYISHRFGNISSGLPQMFGWDDATIRLGFEYTLPFYDRLCLGIGRSSYLKTWDAFAKWQPIKQAKGKLASPITIDFLASIAINTVQFAMKQKNDNFQGRMSYAFQMLAARKFGKIFSLQLMPTVVHYNLVPLREDQNTTFYLGGGLRFRISPSISIVGEYYWPIYGQNFPEFNGQPIVGSAGLGISWETGGHVFQLFVTNAQAMFTSGFVAQTIGRIADGQIRFGFNISRSISTRGGPKYKIED